MKQQELDKILDSHELWCQDNKKGEQANLTDLDLRNLDFSRRILHRIILRGADCTNAKFDKTFLDYADCFYTNFSGATIRNANCAYSIFTGARLRNANCAYSTFTQSILRNAVCTDTIFTGATLNRVDCSCADFTGTPLTKTLLAGALLYNAKLANPIIQIGGIGWLKDYTVFHVAENIIQWITYFQWVSVSLEEFIDLIDEEYPETSTEPDVLKYRSEYLAAIEYFKIMRNNYLRSAKNDKASE